MFRGQCLEGSGSLFLPCFLGPLPESLSKDSEDEKKIQESFTDRQADTVIAFWELLPNESTVVLVLGACTQPPALSWQVLRAPAPGSQASPDSSREDKGTGLEERMISGRDSLTFIIVPKNDV